MPHRHPTFGEFVVEQARQLSRQQEAADASAGQPGSNPAAPQASAGDSVAGFVYDLEFGVITPKTPAEVGMIYGMYLSAAGVMTNSYRQDIHANNIANAETVGFKRDVATFKERMTEAQARRAGSSTGNGDETTNDLLEGLGGGLFAFPTFTDKSQGEFEETGNPLDIAIQGKGFLAVKDGENTRLTRDGRMMLNRKGELILANGTGQPVLDDKYRRITLDRTKMSATTIGERGEITQGGQLVATIGLFEPTNPSLMIKRGGNMLDPGESPLTRTPAAQLRTGFTERSNVDPTTELTQLMDAQRQLEANASMIRYQDQSLGRLVSEVGKIG